MEKESPVTSNIRLRKGTATVTIFVRLYCLNCGCYLSPLQSKASLLKPWYEYELHREYIMITSPWEIQTLKSTAHTEPSKGKVQNLIRIITLGYFQSKSARVINYILKHKE